MKLRPHLQGLGKRTLGLRFRFSIYLGYNLIAKKNDGLALLPDSFLNSNRTEMKVLLVDDLLVLQNSLSEFILRDGHKVVLVRSGDDALRQFIDSTSALY